MIAQKTPELVPTEPLASVPRDARRQIGGDTLLRLALAAVHEVPEAELPRTLSGFPNPRMLLTLAAYAYSAGIFDSEDIVYIISEEPQLRYLTAGQPVNENDILRFRRRNGPLLLSVLRHVLAAVATQTSGSRSQLKPQETGNPLTAEERIHLAILSDSLRMDD